MTTTTLITVAPTGAESAKAEVPALPVTLDELVTTARECAALGASVIHVHIRDDDALPTLAEPADQLETAQARGIARFQRFGRHRVLRGRAG